MQPHEESATQETEPAEDTHQAMLHGIFTSVCDVVAMQQVILACRLVGRRMWSAVWRPSRQAREDATLCRESVSRENVMPSPVGGLG